MFGKFSEFAQWSKPYTDRYGFLQGTRLALQIRKASWANPQGAATRLCVPELAHPITVRARTSDVKVVDQVFLDRQAHFPVTGTPRTIIDAGANIGLSSVVFANRFPDARIVALEIDTRNYRVLVENARPYPNIEPRFCGLWSEMTNLEILNPDAEGWAFRAGKATANPANRNTIPAVGVADLLLELGEREIDLLKIDVEGGEIEIFSNGAERWLPQVRQLAVECHDRIRPGCSNAVTDAARAHEFSVSVWGEYLLLESTR